MSIAEDSVPDRVDFLPRRDVGRGDRPHHATKPPTIVSFGGPFCQQLCQHEVQVLCVFHGFPESHWISKTARNRPKTRKMITEET